MRYKLGKSIKLSIGASSKRGYHYQSGLSGDLWNSFNTNLENSISSHAWKDVRDILWLLSRTQLRLKRSLSISIL